MSKCPNCQEEIISLTEVKVVICRTKIFLDKSRIVMLRENEIEEEENGALEYECVKCTNILCWNQDEAFELLSR